MSLWTILTNQHKKQDAELRQAKEKGALEGPNRAGTEQRKVRGASMLSYASSIRCSTLRSGSCARAGGAGVGLVCAHEAGVSSMYIAYIPYAQRMRRRNMRVFMCVHADEGQGWVRGGCSRVCWYPASSEWLSTGSEWLATGSKWLAAGSERAWSAPSGICVVNRVVNRTCSVS